MTRKLISSLVVAIVALTAVGGALAARDGSVLYRFLGQMQSAPAGASLTVSVVQGNRAALRAMLGQSQRQTFSSDQETQFLRWTNGVPTVVPITNIVRGDFVTITLHAPRNTPLATLLQTPARLVSDRGEKLGKPANPLFLFRGTIVSSTPGSVTVDVSGGNNRALGLVVGQAGRQTFATGGETIFLHWQGLAPTVVDGSMLTVGNRVVVRVRAPGRSSLAEVVTTSARRVAEREPVAKAAQQSAQS